MSPDLSSAAAATARKQDSMSIGYGPRTARPSGPDAVPNFGAMAMFHALRGSAASAPASTSALAQTASSAHPDGCYLTRPPSASPADEGERLSPGDVLKAKVEQAFQSSATRPEQRDSFSPASALQPPPTPSLLDGSDGSSGASSAGDPSPPASTFWPLHLPLPPNPEGFVDPASFQALAFSSLQSPGSFEASKAAEMLASNPSWETYAHLMSGGIAEPTTAHPSQLICSAPAPAVEAAAAPGSKRKRSSPSQNGSARRSSKRHCSPSGPTADASASPVPDNDTSGQSFGAAQWEPPVLSQREVNWVAAERAAASGQLPRKALSLLRQSAGREAPGSRSSKGESKWVGTCPGTQPHLDKLRASVLSGERPELAAMYIAKLRPKQVAPARTDTFLSTPARLSKAEKRQNHLASEHKRRMNIRRGYQDLAAHLPSLQDHDRDDIKVGMAMECQFLRKAIDRMRDLAQTHAALISRRDHTINLLGETYNVDLLLPANPDQGRHNPNMVAGASHVVSAPACPTV